MKKFFTIVLTLVIMCFCVVGVSAETLDTTPVDTTYVTTETPDTTPAYTVAEEVITPADTIAEEAITPADTIAEESITPADTIAEEITTVINTEIHQETEAIVEPETMSEEPGNTAIPAAEHLIKFFFNGEVTLPQIIEYTTVALTAILSFVYSKYKRALVSKEKTISKTDIEIEGLKIKNQDMANQVGLLGNMIICAYLSNNLVDPELKKRLAVYAEELMQNTTISQDKLTEKIILAAQNPDYKEKISNLKASIVEEAEQHQENINNIKEDILALSDAINQDTNSQNTKASDVIDNLKIGG